MAFRTFGVLAASFTISHQFRFSIYVTRFYKTNPNRSVSDKIKLIPPLEDGFKKHLFLVAWQDRMVDSGLVKDLRISGVLVDGLTRIVGQTFSVLILLHISH